MNGICCIPRYRPRQMCKFLGSLLILPLVYTILHHLGLSSHTDRKFLTTTRIMPTSLQFETKSPNKSVDMKHYRQVLTTHADSDKVILLALIDTSFLDMTLNFYETSIEKFGITNYLFISSNDKACTKLKASNISCYVYMVNENAEKATSYGTKKFNDKMNIRTFMIIDALQMGFTVLHTDVDVVFLKNPFHHIDCGENCDLATLWDVFAYNAGFMYIRPTESCMDIYTRMVKTATTTTRDDQTALNGAIRDINKNNENTDKRLLVKKLPMEQFLPGLKYFETQNHHFAASDGDNKMCGESCVVVHNNWIVSLEAKRYRFREVHMWLYDGERYYSDAARKYLTYNTPNGANETTQLASLKTALFFGEVLNRTVILPRFHCKQPRECPLNSFIMIADFEKVFADKYRESSFLSHPKVPEAVSSNDSGIGTVYWLYNDNGTEINTTNDIWLDFEKNEGPNRQEILTILGKVETAVLSIGTFKDLYRKSTVPESESEFEKNMSKAFVLGDYRQLETRKPGH